MKINKITTNLPHITAHTTKKSPYGLKITNDKGVITITNRTKYPSDFGQVTKTAGVYRAHIDYRDKNGNWGQTIDRLCPTAEAAAAALPELRKEYVNRVRLGIALPHPRYYSINEVTDLLGTTQDTVKHYRNRFNLGVKVKGRTYYSDNEVRKLLSVKKYDPTF